jgi:hypothetical protein
MLAVALYWHDHDRVLTGPFGHGIGKMGHGHWLLGQVTGIDRCPKMSGLEWNIGRRRDEISKD